MIKPTIGISVDNQNNSETSGRYESAIAYSRGIAQAGGVPLLLPHEPELAERYVELCDGIVLTGGADPKTETFGEPTHPEARLMDPRRQAFELALLSVLDEHADRPLLGVCLGMQLMALHRGGRLHQHLPDLLKCPQMHQGNHQHPVLLLVSDSVLCERTCGDSNDGRDNACWVKSCHRQAVADAGQLRVVARASDGVIEAIDDPARSFYLGVQWHPERGGSGPFNAGLLGRFVAACQHARAAES